MQQVATGAVLNAFGLAGGAGCVQEEQGVLSADPLWLAGGGLLVSHVGHPLVTASSHGDVCARALDDQDILDGAAAAQVDGLVHDGFEGQQLAAAHLVVGRDHGHSARVFNAVTQRLGRETTEHHRMGRANAGAGLHGGHAFDGHGDVDDNAVTLFDAQALQGIGVLAGLGQQLAISDLGHFAAVGFKDDGSLVAEAFFDVAVQAVVGHVQRAVFKPLEERRVGLVEHFGERCLPGDQLIGQTTPVTLVIGFGFFAQGFVGSHTGDVGVFNEVCAGLVNVGTHQICLLNDMGVFKTGANVGFRSYKALTDIRLAGTGC